MNNPVSFILLAPILTLIFALIITVIIYNGHVNRRNKVDYAFSSIDVQLKKRWELIPNLVNTVKGYASHEKALFEEIVLARQNTKNSQAQPEKRFEGERTIDQRLPQLLAIAESYPELKADSQFLNLQRNLTEVESQIAAARRAYNASVMDYNNGIDMFPSSIIANLFKFTRRPHFEALSNERVAKQITI
ncbi:MAG: LemA family protein [Akkermansiaceae bacterium]